uniref:DM13 domain-containing protein n=1 Tax=Panagrellus redivivus TaxID=6233 RepID=A0A7E5A1R7_PANRE
MRRSSSLHSAFALLNSVSALDYYGIRLGQLKNSSIGIQGTVYLANATILQIVDFSIDETDDISPRFFFSTDDASNPVSTIYQVFPSPGGDYLRRIPLGSLSSGMEKVRLVVEIPSEVKWQFFGIASQRYWNYFAAIKLNKTAAEPFCCLTNTDSPWRGIAPKHYEAATDPLVVLDHKTVLLPAFNFKGTAPPDGWIYAGKGYQINQHTGKKGLVLGRDRPEKHCALHEDYDGTKDLIVRLADDQTIYDVDYIAVFCYAYSVDFGHVFFKLDPENNPVPAYIPPISETPLKRLPPSPHC